MRRRANNSPILVTRGSRNFGRHRASVDVNIGLKRVALLQFINNRSRLIAYPTSNRTEKKKEKFDLFTIDGSALDSKLNTSIPEDSTADKTRAVFCIVLVSPLTILRFRATREAIASDFKNDAAESRRRYWRKRKRRCSSRARDVYECVRVARQLNVTLEFSAR